HVPALEANAPRRRLLEREDELGRRRLAAARLADEAAGGPGRDGERDGVDGAHDARGPAERPTAHDEVLGEIDDLEKMGGHLGAAHDAGDRGAPRFIRGAPSAGGVWGAMSGPPMFLGTMEPAA